MSSVNWESTGESWHPNRPCFKCAECGMEVEATLSKTHYLPMKTYEIPDCAVCNEDRSQRLVWVPQWFDYALCLCTFLVGGLLALQFGFNIIDVLTGLF